MIYLDNHATTPLDPVALEAMLPLLTDQFANAGSVTYAAGRQVAETVGLATAAMASRLGAEADELILTSGATESNNLALQGVMHHPRQKRRKVVSLTTEHKAILDPLKRLSEEGFEVQLVPVIPQVVGSQDGSNRVEISLADDTASNRNQDQQIPGQVDLQRLSEAIDENTALVSIMLANNEIGVIQPLAEIAKLCRQRGCYLHTDATQAVGRIRVDVDELDVDLMSFSAHKFYGPKGVGGLYVRRRGRTVRLRAHIVGGGQQNNWRSGTLNTAGIVGMQAALDSTLRQLDQDSKRIRRLRNLLFERLNEFSSTRLNGPPLVDEYRLPGNLNCCFYPLEGQSLMMHTPELAVSSGSACTSSSPEPSHVLQEIGLTVDHARSSLRFGIGRFNVQQEIETASELLIGSMVKLMDSASR